MQCFLQWSATRHCPEEAYGENKRYWLGVVVYWRFFMPALCSISFHSSDRSARIFWNSTDRIKRTSNQFFRWDLVFGLFFTFICIFKIA